MDNEVEIDGKVYAIARMDVFVQFHVARRLGPLAPTILTYLARPPKERDMMDLFYPLMSTLSTLSDNDTDYILNQCLSVVSLKQDKGFAKIWSSGGLMFDDITMPTMLQLTWQVILKDIASFFPSIPATSEAVTAPE